MFPIYFIILIVLMPRQTTCSEYALYYIHRFPKTEKELRIQLIKKWYYESDIDQTMTFLKSKNYINDRTFAKLYIESELVNKGKAPMLVTQKLLQKGLDKQIVTELLYKYQDTIQSGVQERLAKEIAGYKQRWYEWVQIIQKLMGRWYSYRDIKKYIADKSAQDTDWDSDLS